MRKKVITLIRHAESENNLFHESPQKKNIVKPEPDPKITEKGIIQATKLGNYFKENESLYNFDLIVSSPMKRAIETSSIIFDKTNAHKAIWDTVFEANGPFNNENTRSCIKRSEFQKHFPDYSLPITINERGWYHKHYPEPISTTFSRAQKVLKTLINEPNYINIAIVSHCIFISLILRMVLLKHFFTKLRCLCSFSPPNTSLTTFIISDKKIFIKDLMISPHLETPLIIP